MSSISSDQPASHQPAPDTPSSNQAPSAPDLLWNDDGLPVSREFDDPYFSVDNGLEESRYVFLQHNGLPQRWSDWQDNFSIVETGFGTGLNFLMTWESWRQSSKHDSAWLHFTSIEKFPLTLSQLQQALALWPQLSELSAQLFAQYPLPVAGFHRLVWPEERISLTLIFADVKEALPQLSGPVHAWYLDGFAPSKNPQMWSEELFSGMRRLSQRQPDQYQGEQPATVATFTSAGIVRRGLLGAGFNVKRVPGYGRKREMLAGSFNRRQGPELAPCFLHKPWLLQQNTQADDAEVVVIGAGLAGATTARALAERGLKVHVIDAAGIAQQASGNPQGGLYVKLAAGDNAIHTDFYLAAFQYALPYMRRHLGAADADNPYWSQCGVLQLAYDDKEAQRQLKFSQTRSLPEALVQPLDQTQAGKIAGAPQQSGGLFFPQAGWVSPADLCRILLQHTNIRFTQRQVSALQQIPQGWQIQCSDGTILQSSQLVLACANAATNLLPEAYLPLKRIRGQLSYLSPAQTPALNTVLCGRSYMAPARNGRLCLGATYNLRDDDTQLRDSDHQTNLDHLPDFGPQWQDLNKQQGMKLILGGRVGFRCTTPDYLPMVGAVPESRGFVHRFSGLVRNAKRIPAKAAPQYPGLWLNIGHGSRGLASAPLCAELLVQQMLGAPLPVALDVAEALWPGRFLLRDMVRRKLPPELAQG
ncbi:bifunctional tRNA (5-methylaminomethyl-2-thiouridine)(34)-methyltransferase MnmD/FAD-dependent 5-carboxymethylaminomethyl-2-thiouridine(34) oxidoreductase MnmC [Thalassolituus alkanivorans]|uniref:bifunctional tRNA (5-methylaminomethyl-2-thiouridine)(34)-methyltransferase MnmD/FAD-dependent 5-carboxymethylaminomethyl-2-thiouridine(34) oxidoreductase MnmC n=1 Tax=Thalassolituus alkanivorans TaxID=2881055 RepID=UPI001E36F09F|nr:bifunctional tRNA (5-methylaminomethyl-2-thiouridine)(34)-methyltransferase MnmD/FAD-dependent 5-carboxymethylaminomethyl-2-thiouridine(34) oxidoreductase MnmC [Thalassolituus alkanivorans]MCB2385748.1 bifunctional tRNA (5-methylaminomethyl-2-thiouridine)(34)-methyltransferase MnmD/FAD-dependent 5-carboxymethylaminomethyl-2-thiouridine(34) oxidoreductase MnmC [Thalassolituus alkanivorans]MCB2424064.1 bifunctional tRNA (5-methylaminomethyl-2-thiouridine)(34)-methyltransferase MnmD/FAD-dependent